MIEERARPQRADGCVQLHDMEAKCLELAARAAEPKLRKHLLKMARLFQKDASLLAKSRACIAESERAIACNAAGRAIYGTDRARPHAGSRAAGSQFDEVFSSCFSGGITFQLDAQSAEQ
jgi:hypothetical protein